MRRREAERERRKSTLVEHFLPWTENISVAGWGRVRDVMAEGEAAETSPEPHSVPACTCPLPRPLVTPTDLLPSSTTFRLSQQFFS